MEKAPKNGMGEGQKRIQDRIWNGILAALGVFIARYHYQFIQQVALDAPDIDQGR